MVATVEIYNKIVGGAQAAGGVKKMLFEAALSAKVANLHATGATSHGFWDRLVFKKVGVQLGLDRCKAMLSGSAPIGANVKDFMRVATAHANTRII